MNNVNAINTLKELLGEKVTTEILEETFNEMGLGPKDNINYELFKTFIA